MLRHRWCGALFRLGMGLGLLLCAARCTATPPSASSVAAADPAARVPAIQYGSVTRAGTLSPVEPKPWPGSTRSVAPLPAQPKGLEQ
jgi:hypothetical protein